MPLLTNMQVPKNILLLLHTQLLPHLVIKHRGISPNCFTLLNLREILPTLLELVLLCFILELIILLFVPIFPPVDVLNAPCFLMTVLSPMLTLLMLPNLLTLYPSKHHPMLLPAKQVTLTLLYLKQV